MSRPTVNLIEHSRTEVSIVAPEGTWYHNRFKTKHDPNPDKITHRFSIVTKDSPIVKDQRGRSWWVNKNLRLTKDRPASSVNDRLSIHEDPLYPHRLINVLKYHFGPCKKMTIKSFRDSLPEGYLR